MLVALGNGCNGKSRTAQGNGLKSWASAFQVVVESTHLLTIDNKQHSNTGAMRHVQSILMNALQQ